MWAAFIYDDINYLIHVTCANKIKIILTNLHCSWEEELTKELFLQRLQSHNTSLVASLDIFDKLLNKLLNTLRNDTDNKNITLTQNGQELKVDIKVLSNNYPVLYTFLLRTLPDNSVYDELVLPLVKTVSNLEIIQSQLCEIIQAKDREIEEHKIENGEITSKNLVTEKFEPGKTSDDSNDLLTNLFGKLDEFNVVFNKKNKVVQNLLKKPAVMEHRMKKKKLSTVKITSKSSSKGIIYGTKEK